MATAVSAPGKVLLAGGYLVLDRAYTALVFGLSARIHVVVRDAESSLASAASEIIVESPQFRDAQWRYRYQWDETQGALHVSQVQDAAHGPASRNPFVETALSYALNYVASAAQTTSLKPTLITILADSEYYSQTGPATSSFSDVAGQQFLDFGVRLQDAHKTGLGSSAALVTAFSGAVLSHYLPRSLFTISTTRGNILLHNLAQTAHCAAQGKVGSGFDVAAAVYGTCIYRRFSPSTLSILDEPASPNFAQKLRNLVDDPEEKWDTEINKSEAQIPDGMTLVMCDVDCGSETVSMVKKVLEWRKQNPSDAKALWDQLQGENEMLAQRLRTGTLKNLSDSFSAIRAHIREMGQRSGVPIEPPEQTALLDAVTAAVDGVVGGVVPGAGGYDAIVLLMKGDEVTTSELRSSLKEWSSTKDGHARLLGVKGEMEGARKEDERKYGSWIK